MIGGLIDLIAYFCEFIMRYQIVFTCKGLAINAISETVFSCTGLLILIASSVVQG